MTASSDSTLLLVYNVDGSPVALLKDLYQGLTTGSTDCNLCDLSFATLLKDRSWKRFVADLPVDVDFVTRSTFRHRYPDLAGAGFPSGWWVSGEAVPERAISAEQMDALDDLDALRRLVAQAVGARSDN